MNSSIEIKLSATEAQLKAFETRCGVAEYLLADTLSKRIEGLPAAQAAPLIRDWFQTVRSMAVANHVVSGIHLEIIDPAELKK